MRGKDRKQTQLFSYVDTETRIPSGHPLRLIRKIVNSALTDMDAVFTELYSDEGRPSIPPEYLLRASLLQAFYGIRSERQLMEQLNFNLLYRWFVGLAPDDKVWNATVFCKNRDRLLQADIAAQFLAAILAHKRVKKLLSRDHFSVDGTLIDAWASMKSFVPDDDAGDDGSNSGGSSESSGGRNQTRNFRNQKRSNATHTSRTDADAQLYRKGKGKESRLCYMGHVLMENRSGLAVAGCLTQASGTAEREAALALLAQHRPGARRITLGADKGYDVWDFVTTLRGLNITPHIAINGSKTSSGKRRKTAIDRRTTRHPGYGISQIIRKRVEEPFGWIKSSAMQGKTKFRGKARVEAGFLIGVIANNLMRLPNLLTEPI